MTGTPAEGPAPDGAGPHPSLFILDEVTLTEDQWTEVMSRWSKVIHDQPARFWPPLPRRVRIRLAIGRAITNAGIWLGDHVSWSAAERLWRITGTLR